MSSFAEEDPEAGEFDNLPKVGRAMSKFKSKTGRLTSKLNLLSTKLH